MEESLIEMYLAGISVRRVEDITEALWGTRVSPATVSNLNKKIYAKIEAWRNRPITGEHPYLYLDGIVMKRSWAGEVRNVSLLVASAVNSEGFREILGICEGAKEDKSGWSAFLRHLVERGLKGVRLIISDACRGLVESAAEYLPDARWQRCMVHFYRNIFSHVPATRVRDVSHMLKAIHAQESRSTADAKATSCHRRTAAAEDGNPGRQPSGFEDDRLGSQGKPATVTEGLRKIVRTRSRYAAGRPPEPKHKSRATPPEPDGTRPPFCRRRSPKPPTSKRPTSTASRSMAASRIKPATVNQLIPRNSIGDVCIRQPKTGGLPQDRIHGAHHQGEFAFRKAETGDLLDTRQRGAS